jgi:signal transduction histidine kinase
MNVQAPAKDLEGDPATGAPEPPAKPRRRGLNGELARLEASNERPLAEARAVLVLASLVIVLFEPLRSFSATLLFLLLGYGTYSLVLLWQLNRGAVPRHARSAYWVDLLCYGTAIALSGGLASSFGIFLLYPVLIASYQDGMRRGMLVAVSCTVIFMSVGAVELWSAKKVDWHELEFTSAALLLFVPLVVARWGQAERTIVRRLAFSNDLNRTFTPRNGLDHALTQLAELLRDYKGADGCTIVISDPTNSSWMLYQSDINEEGEGEKGRRIPENLAQPLVSAGGDYALVYAHRHFWSRRPACGAYDCVSSEPQPLDPTVLTGIADFLGTQSFISLPVRVRRQVIGRFHLTSRELSRFSREDIAFLAQVMSQTEVMIENLQLVERLVFEVASEERKRISRDLHDSTVQPYIGLKLGLEALKRRLSANNPAGQEVEDLLTMANDGIVQLRHYVGSLKDKPASAQPVSLVPAVRLQANKFSEFYGINARVVANDDVLVDGHVFEELMHIVREGLSNIRRHTVAEQATITLASNDDELTLEFANDKSVQRSGSGHFFPRSINERAKELGGRVNIEQHDGGQTIVAVHVPL